MQFPNDHLANTDSLLADYKFLGVLKRQFPTVPILGLTATATQEVVDDVIKMLSIPNSLILRAPLNRANLFYEVSTMTFLNPNNRANLFCGVNYMVFCAPLSMAKICSMR